MDELTAGADLITNLLKGMSMSQSREAQLLPRNSRL
jgi:hypothetical protein